jgi:hypothetical protein
MAPAATNAREASKLVAMIFDDTSWLLHGEAALGGATARSYR